MAWSPKNRLGETPVSMWDLTPHKLDLVGLITVFYLNKKLFLEVIWVAEADFGVGLALKKFLEGLRSLLRSKYPKKLKKKFVLKYIP